MGKKKEQKIMHYIRSGKVKRLRKFVKKHNVKIGSIKLSNGLSMLHLASQYLNAEIVDYLLKYKIDACLKDNKGNVALLTAMKNALRTTSSSYAYSAIVLPLLRYCPEALFIANNKGKMAKTLLKELEDRCNFQQEQQNKAHQARKSEIDDWTRKLQEELEDEINQEMFWGEDEFCEWESFDDWANRISHEYSQKKARESFKCYGSASSSKSTTGQTKWTPKDQAQFQRKCQEEEEKRRKQKAEKEKRNMIRLKEQYELLCHNLFSSNSSIHPEDIPKASNEFIQYLLCDIEEMTSQQQYLREQQIQWHPDKFLQKCSHRLDEKLKAQILDQVKLISQTLNAAMEEQRAKK